MIMVTCRKLYLLQGFDGHEGKIESCTERSQFAKEEGGCIADEISNDFKEDH